MELLEQRGVEVFGILLMVVMMNHCINMHCYAACGERERV